MQSTTVQVSPQELQVIKKRASSFGFSSVGNFAVVLGLGANRDMVLGPIPDMFAPGDGKRVCRLITIRTQDHLMEMIKGNAVSRGMSLASFIRLLLLTANISVS